MRRIILRNRPTLTGVTSYDYSWTLKCASIPDAPNVDGPIVVFAFGNYWRIGGAVDAHMDTDIDRIFYSSDLITWFEYIDAGDGRPSRRHWCGNETVTIEGVDWIYVISGDAYGGNNIDPDFNTPPSNGYSCDIKRWRGPGYDWELVLASNDAPWAGTMLNVFGQSPDALWAFGGQDGFLGEDPATRHNWLFKSTDWGFTWTTVQADRASSSTYPSVRGQTSRLAYFLGKMWIVAGGSTEEATDPDRHAYREVWSFPVDGGTVWTQHATPPWEAVEYNSVHVFMGRLWTMGGYFVDEVGSSGHNTGNCWSTADGERWIRHETPLWSVSHADGTCINGNVWARVGGNSDYMSNSTAYAFTATPAGIATVIDTPRAAWDAAIKVLDGSDVDQLTDTSGNGHNLEHVGGGTAPWHVSDDDFGGKPSAESQGGSVKFLGTVNAVDLSTFAISMVVKIDGSNTDPFYVCYAIDGPDYFYVYGTFNATGRLQLQIAINRSGILTAGTAADLFLPDDISHVLTFTYGGTSASTRIRIDGADMPSLTMNGVDAGSGAFDAALHFFSDNTGSAARIATMAAARLYEPVDAQVRAHEPQLRDTYPYKLITP